MSVSKIPESRFPETRIFKYPKTKKAVFLQELLELSYTMDCQPTEWETMHLYQLISRERNPELQEALEDLDEFLCG